MQTLHVELGDRRYPIFIGSHLDPKALLEPYLQGCNSGIGHQHYLSAM